MFRLLNRGKSPFVTREKVTNIGTGANLDNPTKIMSLDVSDADRQRGMMIVGTTGVGKTRLEEHMITQDIAKGYNVVVFDPKGDQALFSKIYELAVKHDRREDLILVTPLYPELSALINPMQEYFMIDEPVDHVTAAIPPSRDEVFKWIAKEIAMSVISAEIILAEQEKRLANLNFENIRKKISKNALTSTKEALLVINTHESNRVAGIINDVLQSGPEHLAKVSMSLRTALMDLSAGNIGKIIGQADCNRFSKRVEKDKKIIMVVHTGAMLIKDGSKTLGRVLVSMIQKFIGRTYSSTKEVLDTALAIYIDEAQRVVYEGIETLPAMAGSAKVMTTFLIQDIAQLSAELGEYFAKIILNNCNTKIFMRCPDADTSDYVTRHFGTKNVLTGIYSPNQVTTREVEQDVIKAYDVLSLQNREFLMLSYSGRFKGKTAEIKKSSKKIEFPKAPTMASFNDEQEPNALEGA
jgi:type IV secretory pathway TraG/TraD family ATPase VirD4